NLCCAPISTALNTKSRSLTLIRNSSESLHCVIPLRRSSMSLCRARLCSGHLQEAILLFLSLCFSAVVVAGLQDGSFLAAALTHYKLPSHRSRPMHQPCPNHPSRPRSRRLHQTKR